MAAKKAVTKVARKPRVTKAATPVDDGVYWVISEREFLTWSPVFVFRTAAEAQSLAQRLENDNPAVLQRYKVSRVTMAV